MVFGVPGRSVDGVLDEAEDRRWEAIWDALTQDGLCRHHEAAMIHLRGQEPKVLHKLADHRSHLQTKALFDPDEQIEASLKSLDAQVAKVSDAPRWHQEQLTISLHAAVAATEILEQDRPSISMSSSVQGTDVTGRLTDLATCLGTNSERQWVITLGDIGACELAFLEHTGLEDSDSARLIAYQVYKRSNPLLTLKEIRRYENHIAGLTRTGGPLLIGAPSLGKRR